MYIPAQPESFAHAGILVHDKLAGGKETIRTSTDRDRLVVVGGNEATVYIPNFICGGVTIFTKPVILIHKQPSHKIVKNRIISIREIRKHLSSSLPALCKNRA